MTDEDDRETWIAMSIPLNRYEGLLALMEQWAQEDGGDQHAWDELAPLLERPVIELRGLPRSSEREPTNCVS